jgi:hypothetical protein
MAERLEGAGREEHVIATQHRAASVAILRDGAARLLRMETFARVSILEAVFVTWVKSALR